MSTSNVPQRFPGVTDTMTRAFGSVHGTARAAARAVSGSVVTPERKDVGWTRFTVTNATWETAPSDGWRVSGGSDLEKEPCVGS